MSFPRTIDLGKFRVGYEERERTTDGANGYLLQQRAVIRRNEALVKLDNATTTRSIATTKTAKKQPGTRPSPLQYFIASSGFCKLSQLKRLVAKSEIALDDLEMDSRVTCVLTASFRSKIFPPQPNGPTTWRRDEYPGLCSDS